MMSRFAFFLLAALIFAPATQAQYRCSDLISKAYKRSAFVFHTTQIDPEILLQTAFINFNEKTPTAEMIQVFNEIEVKGSKNISKNEIKVLKTARKQFSILRSALQISTVDHRAPKNFDRFVKDFGHLNDFIATKNYKSANQLLIRIKANMTQVDLAHLYSNSNLTTQESLRIYYEDLKQKATEIMSTKKISLDAYHDVRKVVREFLSLSELAEQLAPSSQNRKNFDFLLSLNIKLGNTNDTFTQKILNGDFDKHDTQIKFPKELRKDVEYFINELETY